MIAVTPHKRNSIEGNLPRTAYRALSNRKAGHQIDNDRLLSAGRSVTMAYVGYWTASHVSFRVGNYRAPAVEPLENFFNGGL